MPRRPLTAPTAKTAYPHHHGPPPRRSKAKRTNPYTAVFNMTPDISADTGLGAMGWARGSQRWRGIRPALVPNPTNANKKINVLIPVGTAPPAIRIEAKIGRAHV